jgi:hypothetical protein
VVGTLFLGVLFAVGLLLGVVRGLLMDGAVPVWGWVAAFLAGFFGCGFVASGSGAPGLDPACDALAGRSTFSLRKLS